jgi:hypothetical protein
MSDPGNHHSKAAAKRGIPRPIAVRFTVVEAWAQLGILLAYR